MPAVLGAAHPWPGILVAAVRGGGWMAAPEVRARQLAMLAVVVAVERVA